MFCNLKFYNKRGLLNITYVVSDVDTDETSKYNKIQYYILKIWFSNDKQVRTRQK